MQTACFFIRGVASSLYRFKHTFTRAGLVPNSFLPQWDWKVSPPALLVMWHPSARSGLSTRLDIPSSDNLHGKAVVETKIWTRCQDVARCCLLSESTFLPSTAGCRQVWDVNSQSPFFCMDFTKVIRCLINLSLLGWPVAMGLCHILRLLNLI